MGRIKRIIKVGGLIGAVLLTVLIIYLAITLIQRAYFSKVINPQVGFNVGYKISTLNYKLFDGSQKSLTFALWYPTNAMPQKYSYNRFISPAGMVAQDTPVYKDPTMTSGYPLIILSHGSGGCGNIYSYITSYLASQGYIVAAPDHQDAGVFCTIDNEPGLGTSQCHKTKSANFLCYRPEDVSAVINELLKENADKTSIFYQTIDSSDIGVIGHSAGGLTAMQLIGLEPSLTDKRIKAAAMLAEDTGVYPSSAYAKISVPTLFEIGSLDTSAHSAKDTARNLPFLNAPAPKFLYTLSGDWHLAFDDTVCIGYKTIEDCQMRNPKVQPILKSTLAFFNQYLKHQSKESVLTNSSNSMVGMKCQSYQLINQPLVGSSCP